MDTRHGKRARIEESSRTNGASAATGPSTAATHMMFRLPTPASLSPPSNAGFGTFGTFPTKKVFMEPQQQQQHQQQRHKWHSAVSDTLDSWQSRLSSPLPSPDTSALDPRNFSPYSQVYEHLQSVSPRLTHLLQVEACSAIERQEWTAKNKNFPIDYALFDIYRNCINKTSDEPNETAFVAVSILRKIASKKRIITHAQKEAYSLASLLLASKICEESDPKVEHLIKYSKSKTVTVPQVLSAERRLAVDLEWQFQFASPTELGYAMLDCFYVSGQNPLGLKPNVKMAIMAVAEPVIYNWLFGEPHYKPSLIVASVLCYIFVYIFKRANCSSWITFFSSLIDIEHCQLGEVVEKIKEPTEKQINSILPKSMTNGRLAYSKSH